MWILRSGWLSGFAAGGGCQVEASRAGISEEQQQQHSNSVGVGAADWLLAPSAALMAPRAC